MTSLAFAELLIDLHLYSGLIPVAVAIILWKYQANHMRVFAVNQILSFGIFAFSIILQKQNVNNHFIDFLHSIRTLVFVFWMYGIYDQNTKHRWILGAVALLGIGFVLIEWLVFSKNEWSELNEVILSVLMTIVALYYLHHIVHTATQKLTSIPIFWITVATILGNLVAVFSLFFAKQALQYSTEVFLIIWNILSIIGIVCKLLYATGFYMSKQVSMYEA